MNDATTKKPLRVLTNGTAGPYIDLPVSQLEEVRRLLDEHGVYYWVDEFAISLNNEPETILVNFGRGGDAQRVQTLLDSVS